MELESKILEEVYMNGGMDGWMDGWMVYKRQKYTIF